MFEREAARPGYLGIGDRPKIFEPSFVEFFSPNLVGLGVDRLREGSE